MQDLTVSLFQSELFWHQPDANMAMFEEQISANPTETDLIVLPEMFTTGFSMDAEQLAEPMGTRTFKWMQLQAERNSAAIMGSYIVREEGKYFNRLLCVTPDGSHVAYDKRHLFRMAGEHDTYQQGADRPVVPWKGWKICPQICYDLRFPVWSRNRKNQGAPEFDLLVYVANWPAPRVSAWDILLQARAIENASYCVGVNRVGKDGLGIEYVGHSVVVDFKGAILAFQEEVKTVINVTLSHSELNEYRKKFPVHLDGDQFTIGIN